MRPKAQKQENKGQLFAKLSFILLTDSLNKRTVENVCIQVLENGGSVQTIQCAASQGRKIKADYLLADPRLDVTQIRENLAQTVNYKDVIDLSFIEACVSSGKVLPILSFTLSSAQKQKQITGQPKKRTKVEKIEQKQQQKPKCKEVLRPKDITKTSNNKFIIQQLSKLLKVYSNEGDKGRKIAYSRAIGAIKSLDKELQTEQDVQKLKSSQKHIGSKIVDKIKQLLKTGSITKLQKLKNTEQNIALQQITRVWGIGAAKAKEMYQRGVRNLEDLKKEVEKYPDVLTKNQKIGLKYVEDLEIRIPRKKVTLMFQFVRDVLFQIVGSKDLHQIQACGSYRREKPTCGDIDIFITRKDGEYQKLLLTKLVQKLTQKGFLTDNLTTPRHPQNRSCQSYMGICTFKDSLHHRIDIKYYPQQQFAFAVLYFTGSDMFNRKMRLQALEKGYHLSDHGMYQFKKNQDKSQQKGANVQCKSQKEIFQVLGILYKEPRDREA